MNDLSLQIGFLNLVKINKTYRSNAGSSKILCKRCAKSSYADYQNLSRFKLFLSFYSYFFQQQMTGIPLYLIIGKLLTFSVAQNTVCRRTPCNSRYQNYFIAVFYSGFIAL